jgi:hypothetical protein
MATVLSNAEQTIWSIMIKAARDKALVAGALCNRDYEGDAKANAFVKATVIGDVSATQYTKNADITYSSIDDKSLTIAIDQEWYVAVQIDDIEKMRSNPTLLTRWTQKAGQALASKIDANILGKYTDAGISLDYSSSGLDSGNVLDGILAMRAKFTANDVPENTIIPFIVDAYLAQTIKKAGILSKEQNTTEYESGFVGRFAGFNIYSSNNVTVASGSWDDGNLITQCMAWTPEGITLATQMEPSFESLRADLRFATNLRALNVWGSKVILAKEVCSFKVKVLQETSV